MRSHPFGLPKTVQLNLTKQNKTKRLFLNSTRDFGRFNKLHAINLLYRVVEPTPTLHRELSGHEKNSRHFCLVIVPSKHYFLKGSIHPHPFSLTLA